MSDTICRQPSGIIIDFLRDGEPGLTAEVRYVEVRQRRGGGPRVILALALDYQAWIRMDDEHWFGMSLASIDPRNAGYSFHALLPVLVEIGLAEAEGGRTAAATDEASLAATLAAAIERREGAWLDESRWRWRKVLQGRSANAGGVATGVLEGIFSIYDD